MQTSYPIEKRDKQIAGESIVRYQLKLRDPEKRFSHMLDVIDFHKNLDKWGFFYRENHSRILTSLQNVLRNEARLERRSSRSSYIKPSNVHERHDEELARGRGILHTQGNRIPYCEDCKQEIRGAYVLANGLTYCPDHFVCSNKPCARRLLDIGFVEEKGRKYCERCFETQIAPHCAKCSQPITADCLNALQKQWHPHCFVCTHCHNPFGNSAFFLEQGQPYCETGKLSFNFLSNLILSILASDWNTLFTTKCVSCHYPIEAGDRWVEALGAAFHSNCFNCTVNLCSTIT
uniref:LIM zinc-binding domain-containing protein n=1 Tax=Setaria digitata TaxID=48799 RepID=A0A915Q143_9BILA